MPSIRQEPSSGHVDANGLSCRNRPTNSFLFVPLGGWMRKLQGSRLPWRQLSRPPSRCLALSGLATITSVLTCAFSPGTFFHPHVHFEGCEEVWTAIDRPIHVLMGKQLRMQPPGTGYCVPPDGNTPHGNFNVSDDLVTMFYFSVRKDRVRD